MLLVVSGCLRRSSPKKALPHFGLKSIVAQELVRNLGCKFESLRTDLVLAHAMFDRAPDRKMIGRSGSELQTMYLLFVQWKMSALHCCDASSIGYLPTRANLQQLCCVWFARDYVGIPIVGN